MHMTKAIISFKNFLFDPKVAKNKKKFYRSAITKIIKLFKNWE